MAVTDLTVASVSNPGTGWVATAGTIVTALNEGSYGSGGTQYADCTNPFPGGVVGQNLLACVMSNPGLSSTFLPYPIGNGMFAAGPPISGSASAIRLRGYMSTGGVNDNIFVALAINGVSAPFGVTVTLGTISAGYEVFFSSFGINHMTQADAAAITVSIRAASTAGGVARLDSVSVRLASYVIDTPTTGLLPANGSTVTTGKPALGLYFSQIPPDNGFKREWQFATNVGFTLGVVTATEPTAHQLASAGSNASLSYSATGAARLPAGTVFGRYRLIDGIGGAAGPYSATQTFTVTHVPSTTTRAPGAGTTLAFGATLLTTWAFSDIDTTDSQSKYQAKLWKATAPGSPIDSTLLVSTNAFHSFTIPDATWKDIDLRWAVQVADQDGTLSGFSPEQSVFLSDAPTVAVTSPTLNQVITTSAPLITWSFTATLGRIQSQYKVDITNLTAGTVVYTSGWVSSSVLQHQVTVPAIIVGQNYSVSVSTVDSTSPGLASLATQPFTASYSSPAAPTFSVDSSSYSTLAVINLDWSGASIDPSFYVWRVYRRLVGATAYTLIATIGTATIKSYADYTAGSQVAYEYAVVQVINSFGVLVESTYNPKAGGGTIANYVITVPLQPSLNAYLWHVTDETFADEQEMATINLPGRGRVAQYGGRYGEQGSLSFSLMLDTYLTTLTPRQQRLALEAIRNSGRDAYLINPFGDVYKLVMNTIQFTRVAGTGLNELLKGSMDYVEITG